MPAELASWTPSVAAPSQSAYGRTWLHSTPTVSATHVPAARLTVWPSMGDLGRSRLSLAAHGRIWSHVVDASFVPRAGTAVWIYMVARGAYAARDQAWLHMVACGCPWLYTVACGRAGLSMART